MRRSATIGLRNRAFVRASGRAAALSRMTERLLGIALLIFYYVRRVGWSILRPITLNARALVVDGDQLLLVRVHGSRYWHLPGGGVKRNENLAEAAAREVFEETGCQVQVDRLLGMYVNYAEHKSEHIAVFVARPLSGLPGRRNAEIAEARFFPVAQLPAQLAPSVRARLDEYLAERCGVVGAWR